MERITKLITSEKFQRIFLILLKVFVYSCILHQTGESNKAGYTLLEGRKAKASPTHGRTDGPTDRRTDGRTDTPSYRVASSRLKITSLVN